RAAAIGARMVTAAVGEIAIKCRILGRHLPFRLGRKPLPGPFGVSIGLVITDMHNRRGGVEALFAGQREYPPALLRGAPIERRLPTLLLHRRPALGQPIFGLTIAARGDELGEFAAAHRPARQAERVEPHAMPRRLVVESKNLALVADPYQPARKVDPLERHPGAR